MIVTNDEDVDDCRWWWHMIDVIVLIIDYYDYRKWKLLFVSYDNYEGEEEDIGDDVFYDDHDDVHYMTMMMMYRCWWFWCRCDDDDDDDVYSEITLTVFIWYSSLNTSSQYGNHCHHIIHHAVLVFACMHKGFHSMDDALILLKNLSSSLYEYHYHRHFKYIIFMMHMNIYYYY